MTRRKLTQDEIALWKQVNERTDRMHKARPQGDDFGSGSLSKPKPKKPAGQPYNGAPFELGQSATHMPVRHDLKKPLGERLTQAPVAMDRKAYGRMRRGKMAPEMRLDLHGMTLDRAHPALIRFVLTAHAEGRRLVLVITGKGKAGQDDGPIPRPRGVLKHQVPDWLSRPPLAQAVLQVTEAHISHGGAGAYYVYLRRGR